MTEPLNRINGRDSERTEFEIEAEALGGKVRSRYKSSGPNSLWRFAFAMIALTAIMLTIFYLIYRVMELRQ